MCSCAIGELLQDNFFRKFNGVSLNLVNIALIMLYLGCVELEFLIGGALDADMAVVGRILVWLRSDDIGFEMLRQWI